MRGSDNEIMSAHPDEGCDYALCCTRCPYLTCYFELSIRDRRFFKRIYAKERRDTAIVRAWRKGVSMGKLSIKYNLAESTVARIIRRAR